MCKVSVLIPAYNVESYIRECLDSVLTQTMQDFEILCVDDASTDQTLAILREYERKDSRIHVYCHTENKGQSCGRNLAFSHASGEYVYMLDADDKIVPGALEELYEICHKEQLDVAGFENFQFTEDASLADRAAIKTIVYEEVPVMNGREALIHCMKKDLFSLSVPTFFMRRGYLQETGLRFVEGILHEDVGFLFELMTRAERIHFLHKIYFLRRIRGKSTMTSRFTSKNIEGYLKSFLRSFDLEPILNKYLEEDSEFHWAVKKWRRDIYGRLRQLYLASEDTIYGENGGNVGEEIRRMFEVLKLSAYGTGQARDVLGENLIQILKGLPVCEEGMPPKVYICGTGQYAERTLNLVGALDIQISGILVTERTQMVFRGFPVYEGVKAPDKTLPVLFSVSHYKQEEYHRMLLEAGFSNVLYPEF